MKDKPLTDTDWQIIQQLSERFGNEQLLIEPDKNGLTTELKKVVAYLYAKVHDNTLTPEQRSDSFRRYLVTLSKSGKQIARSGKTPDYYKSIYNVYIQDLKDYHGKPELMLQILGWTARLVIYYKDSNQNDKYGNVKAVNSKNSDRPILKSQNKPGNSGNTTNNSQTEHSNQSSESGGKNTMQIALEKARQRKKGQ